MVSLQNLCSAPIKGAEEVIGLEEWIFVTEHRDPRDLCALLVDTERAANLVSCGIGVVT